jgi:SAM-dependent methyltransferase
VKSGIRDPICLSAVSFKKLNAHSWDANAEHWQRHVLDDPFRVTIFEEVRLALSEEQSRFPRARFDVCDVGCGEGSFLRRLQADGAFTNLSGVDLCPKMLALARNACPPARLFQRDLEEPDPPPVLGSCAVTCVLAMIEIVQFRRAFDFVWEALRADGLLVLVLLDPAIEIYRLMSAKRKLPGTVLYDLEGDLAIASHYEAEGIRSPAPYFRILRPLDAYVGGLIEAGFEIESIKARPHTGGPLSSSARAIFVGARKRCRKATRL